MTPREAAQLLNIIAEVDNRTVSSEAAMMWAGILADVPVDAAMRAVTAHYRDSAEWLMPVHIVRHVRSERKTGTMSEMVPDDCMVLGRAHRRLPDGTCILCTMRGVRA